MPYGKYPERVGPFQKWAQDQVKRGDVAGNRVTSRSRKTRRARRRKRRKQDG